MAPSPLVERIALRQERMRARAAILRRWVPDAARRLRARGARSVRLFGSLATGVEPDETTGMDLCVEGLDEDAVAEATLELEALVQAKVDIVRWESASDRLRMRVERDGVEVAVDAL